VLAQIIAQVVSNTPPLAAAFPDLLVGAETSDDAAVYRLNAQQAIVVTTDFFLPIVDHPFDFGRIAAANALSDVYAMGAKPILALAIAGMPVDKLPLEMIQDILAGGASICAEAGIPIAGGHSIDSAEPIYGLVAVGLADPPCILRNSTAQAGDRLILTKPLGVGIYSAAFKRQQLDDACYREMLTSTTQLNSIGAQLPNIEGVHAVTDVTGFGLLGHLLEMCRGSVLGARLAMEQIPLLSAARQLSESGIGTGAAKRNWSSYGADVDLTAEWHKNILCDPQTSGGLLIACSAEAEPAVRSLVPSSRVIGELTAGPPRVHVE
jgi:selenide, water dikinase